MGKKTSQKFITLTAVLMCIIMVVYVATMFITVNVADYSDVMDSSEFINGVNNGSVKLKNEDYSLKEVKCVVSETGEEIVLSELKGSDKEIRSSLVEKMDYTVISRSQRKNGDDIINIMADSDKSFELEWKSNNSPAKLIWFPQHPTTKDFINSLKSDYYNPQGVTYDINDIVLFPAIMFVLGLAGAVLVVVFRRLSFFLAFPIVWCISGLASHISGFAGSTVPQFFVFSILKGLSPAVFTVQFIFVILVVALVVASIIFRRLHHQAIVAEEAAYYAEQ